MLIETDIFYCLCYNEATIHKRKRLLFAKTKGVNFVMERLSGKMSNRKMRMTVKVKSITMKIGNVMIVQGWWAQAQNHSGWSVVVLLMAVYLLPQRNQMIVGPSKAVAKSLACDGNKDGMALIAVFIGKPGGITIFFWICLALARILLALCSDCCGWLVFGWITNLLLRVKLDRGAFSNNRLIFRKLIVVKAVFACDNKCVSLSVRITVEFRSGRQSTRK